jgi:hypothetical protein
VPLQEHLKDGRLILDRNNQVGRGGGHTVRVTWLSVQ